MTIVILTSVLRQTHINSCWSITIKWYSNINFYLYKRCLVINNQTCTADQYLLTINRPHTRYSQLIIKAQSPTDRTLQKTCHCNAQEHVHPCNKRSYSYSLSQTTQRGRHSRKSTVRLQSTREVFTRFLCAHQMNISIPFSLTTLDSKSHPKKTIQSYRQPQIICLRLDPFSPGFLCR